MRLSFTALLLTIFLNLFAPIHNYDVVEYRQQQIETEKQIAMIDYLKAIAKSESSGRYDVFNKYGYIGKYQFGYSARKATGYADVHFKDFVKNPSVWPPSDQDRAMIRLLEINEKHLEKLIKKVESDHFSINGIVITKSGILAGAHLAGFAGVKRYFATGHNAKDVYGTSVEKYMVKFSGYRI